MNALERAADLRRIADAIEAHADLMDELGVLGAFGRLDMFYVKNRELMARVVAAFPTGSLDAKDDGNATWIVPFGGSELRFVGRADLVLDRVESEQTVTTTVVEYRLPETIEAVAA